MQRADAPRVRDDGLLVRTTAPPGCQRGRLWYAVLVLVLSLFVNLLGRGILALLVPYIKADLRLSDTQISLIMGFASRGLWRGAKRHGLLHGLHLPGRGAGRFRSRRLRRDARACRADRHDAWPAPL